MKRIHCLMHVPFEGLGCMEEWFKGQGMSVSYTRLYDWERLPNMDEFDGLVIMGGPMGIYDYEEYVWLKPEKHFIAATIKADKQVLGVCLGAQLIADVLGAKISPNNEKEIGWFDISLTDEGKSSALFKGFEDSFKVLHWHGDTFGIPEGATRLLSTDVCQNQAFLFNDKVLGLQFHFEATHDSLEGMLTHCANELVDAPFIQMASQIRSGGEELIDLNNQMMHKVLERLYA